MPIYLKLCTGNEADLDNNQPMRANIQSHNVIGDALDLIEEDNAGSLYQDTPLGS
jgi:hypothetical protein